ncbi:hypothetical protein [Pseudomonas poae]|uniref:hypothetical protein n=1 Tax=Pseudomonas poae TaxID=200451 RepID=UPI0030CDE6AC
MKMGEGQGKTIHQKLGRLIELNQDIGLRYRLSCELMEDPGVSDCLRFLGELDHLAVKYGFSPSEIIALLNAEDKEGAIIRSEPEGAEPQMKP